MNIAYTIADGRGETDLLLYNVAQQLKVRGFKTAGTVQINTGRAKSGHCDMDVQVLPNGQIIRISQDLGEGAKGCRLNPEALETAVGLVEAQLADGADILIVNKFGKHEAEGRGFRNAIALAVSLDCPVLVGTNSLNRDALCEFTDGAAKWLPASDQLIIDWLEQHFCATALAS